MKTFEFERNGNIGILTFYGEFVLKRADEIKEAFLISFANTDYLTIDFNKVNKVEPVSLHLICFAHRTSRILNKRLTLSGIHTGIFKQAVFDAGYAAHAGCLMI